MFKFPGLSKVSTNCTIKHCNSQLVVNLKGCLLSVLMMGYALKKGPSASINNCVYLVVNLVVKVLFI